jgi:hypothetical protein
MDFPICPSLFEYLPIFAVFNSLSSGDPGFWGCSSCDALVLVYEAVTGLPSEYMR